MGGSGSKIPTNTIVQNNSQHKKPLVSRLLQKLAPQIGAKVFLEPNWKMTGQIVYKDGTKRYFRLPMLDVNHHGSAELAKDKDFSKYFLKKLGYPIIEGETFYSEEWGKTINVTGRGIDDAYNYANQLGFPVIVKPNSGRQGAGVVKVFNQKEFYRAAKETFKKDNIVLVERYVSGKDYRLLIFDNQLVAAYERIPLSILGNGKSTVRELLESKAKKLLRLGRDIKLDINDFRLPMILKRHKLKWTSVPAKDQHIHLLDNANLSTGGESVDVTSFVHPTFAKVAIQITKDMGLRLCGVDLMIKEDISKPAKKGNYFVLEINSSPGIKHYHSMGVKQKQVIENLYLKILKAMRG